MPHQAEAGWRLLRPNTDTLDPTRPSFLSDPARPYFLLFKPDLGMEWVGTARKLPYSLSSPL